MFHFLLAEKQYGLLNNQFAPILTNLCLWIFVILCETEYVMENTEDQGKAEKAFKNFGKRVDAFVVELNEAGDRVQKEFKDRFEELKDSAEKLKGEVKNKERWKEVEASLKKAGEEMNNAFKAAFKKKENS